MTIDEQILQVAHRIGAHWRAQEGVNAALLDELADLTRPREVAHPMTEHAFAGDGVVCMICGEGRRHYLHDDREIRHG